MSIMSGRKLILPLTIASSLLFLTGTACSGGDDSWFTGPPPGSSASPVSSAPPSPTVPPPVSRAVYQQALTDLDAALAPGFTSVGTAQTPADLKAAATAVALNLGTQADELGKIVPPRAVAAEHAGLISGLRGLSTDLSTVAGDADDERVCTGGSGLPRAASGNGAHLFRTAVLGLASPGPDRGYTVGSFLPAGAPDPNRSPGNGDLPGGRRGGLGELTLKTQGGVDHVVKIMNGSDLVRAIFIAAGQDVTVRGIPDGNYEVFVTGGHDWDDANRRFTRDCEFSKLVDPIEYTTSSANYTTWTLTLYTTINGNADSEDVGAGAFPAG